MKIQALDAYKVTLRNELSLRQQAVRNSIQQVVLKIDVDSIEWNRLKQDMQIARIQLNRTQDLNQQGIKSMADLEEKKFKIQELTAKLNAAENRLNITRNEKLNLHVAENAMVNDYLQAANKVDADRASTQAAMMDTESYLDKLRSEAANYAIRTGYYFITAPQDCYVTRILKPGIGEMVKETESVLTILPSQFPLAVAMYVLPVDLPLIRKGQDVRFIFDGWPAIVFSGWPGNSFGTFSGRVAAVDNDISENGKYRIIVAAEESAKKWPGQLRPGSGAKGIALLGNVPMWYEIWRKMNGFPPDFYAARNLDEDLKVVKAPLKSVK